MKEKPPVLSEDEKLGCSLVDSKHSFKELRAVIDETCVHQRDADVDWFEKQGHEAISYLEGYQQARQETAREIENFLEMHLYARPDKPTATMSFNDWMKLKKLLSKYPLLKTKNQTL